MLFTIWFLSFNFSFVISNSFSPILSVVTTRKCKPQIIRAEQCRDKFYKYTSLPNLMGQDQEMDIQIQMDTFRPLLNHKCSNELNFLLCSVYTPICDPEAEILLGPCAGICEKVQTECEPILKIFNLPWPSGLNCSRFPSQSTPELMCMSNPVFDSRSTRNPLQLFNVVNKEGFVFNIHHGRCRHLRHSEKYVFINRTGKCALKCSENDLFSQESKRFAEMWMSVLAVITFLSTLFTCMTFCHSNKIKYPEQPIIFLTLSYNLYSVSLLLRLFFTRSTVSCDYDPVSGQYILIQEGLENTYCAITFLLNFFFNIATHIWWVTLTSCWMLYSVFKVSSFNLKINAGYFHLFVWLSTSMLTVSILILRCVEADELLGICSVGGQSPELLMTFSIIPKSICLIVGTLLLCLGFLFLKTRKKTINKNGKKIRSITHITSVAFRMGIFSGIYILAISIHIVCELYQYINYNIWRRAPQIFRDIKEPIVAIFLLNIFMGQVVGINSAIWIWSLDAATSWKSVFWNILKKLKKKKETQSSTHKTYSSISSHYCQYSKAI
uniref:Fzd-4-3b n=1 Tax=Dendrocoelum lacteum TaxID=27895 RepID=T1E111_9PLAT